MSFRGLLIAFVLITPGLQGDDQQRIETLLADKYVGKVLTLRGFYKQGSLDYDSAGEPKSKRESGPWTLYGRLEVTRMKVKRGKLEIEGNRLWVEWVLGPKGERKMQLVRTTDSVFLRADLSQPEPDEFEIDNVLKRIFVNSKDRMSDLVPEHWRRFFGGTGGPTADVSESKPQSDGPIAVQDETRATNKPQSTQLFQVSEGRLMKRVVPAYPEPAKRARLQGAVVLDAVIDKQGRISDLSVSQPLGLGTEEASVDAVKQWIYKPYLLNGQPVEVETKITLNYQLTP